MTTASRFDRPLTFLVAFAVFSGFGGARWNLGAAGARGGLGADTISLSGCLVRGEGDGAGYLLTNTPSEPWLKEPDTKVKTSALGTSGDYTTVFYWLDGNGDLKQHIGHVVQVDGDLKSNVKVGEIKVDRKDKWTELTIKSDGRTMKAHVPNTSVLPARDHDTRQDAAILVRRIAVEKVRMLGASCEE